MGKINAKVLTVSPLIASEMLKRNTDNRHVRKTNVDKFVKILRAGEWKVTHQGIAFDINDKLVDGQHRLMAIVQAGITVEMMVTYNVDPETFDVIDNGVRRTAADVLKENIKVSEVINLAARLLTGETVPSPASLQKVKPFIAPYAYKIMDVCASNTPFFSSAAMKIGAIARMITEGDEQYVLQTYTDLCRSNIDALPQIGQALVKAYLKKRTHATDRTETMAMALYVFDKRNRNYKQMRLDVPNAPETVRQALRKVCPL